MPSEQEIRYADITKRVNDPVAAAIIMLAEYLTEAISEIDSTKPGKPDK